MSSLIISLIIVVVSLQSVSAALTACPVADTSWSSGTGPNYLVCAGTDYQFGGRSLQLVHGVGSTSACAKICANDTRCQKAVYDMKDKVCHVKDVNSGISMPWEADTNFDTIRIDTGKLVEGSFLSHCPFPQTEYRSSRGAIYNVCRGTDYVGTSAKIVKQVTTVNACADLCTTTNGCVEAVFDNRNKVCHVKGAEPATSLFWVQNSQFTTITLPQQSKPAQKGRWSDIVRLPLIPVAAYVVPQFPRAHRLMFFLSWGTDAFGGPSGLTQFGDLDFVTGKTSAREISNTHHDMFCPVISQLEDGRILVQGGSDAEAVSIYDPDTNNFTRAADMKVARGYQTLTILSDGRVFTIGGAYSGPREAKNGEVYDPKTQKWTYLLGADAKPILTKDKEGIWREDNHAWLFGWKKGSVFQAGPGKDQHWFGTTGTGSITKAATRDTQDSMCGIWAMYDAVAGKILSAAGAQDYTNSDATTKAHITTIREPYKPSTVERVSDLAFPRGFANAVVLPDGTVLVTGGQRKSLVFTNTDGILKWTQLAPHAVPRNYHSVSILLPDSRVFISGGGLCRSVDHLDGEFFESPFLFNDDGTYASQPFTASQFASASLARMGSVTHSVNSDQRRVPLNNVTQSGKDVTVRLPTDSGILLPGFYYLFVMLAKGTPSMGMTVHVVL
ncbi:galactose oxidase [Bimuria novae-zelandiae CBS 107.79]|uniref:Galactose oxidase n=1 Tax=Bimuria novae-zelandiae CBS 107.79 TaxID=1447943 RepID=A0A6A5UN32_9PLEO|nr:galactose oxidase [Bimuria novae-zelandiae CBS 107.79]